MDLVEAACVPILDRDVVSVSASFPFVVDLLITSKFTSTNIYGKQKTTSV